MHTRKIVVCGNTRRRHWCQKLQTKHIWMDGGREEEEDGVGGGGERRGKGRSWKTGRYRERRRRKIYGDGGRKMGIRGLRNPGEGGRGRKEDGGRGGTKEVGGQGRKEDWVVGKS